MRHLLVLAESGLVVSRKRGRERWHYIYAVPLQRLHHRSVGSLEAGWAEALMRFEVSVAGHETMGVDHTALSIDIIPSHARSKGSQAAG